MRTEDARRDGAGCANGHAGESGEVPWQTTRPEDVRDDVLVCHLAVAEILVRRGDRTAAEQELLAVEGRRGHSMPPRTQALVCAIRAEEAVLAGRTGQARSQIEQALDLPPDGSEPELALRLCAIGLSAMAGGDAATRPQGPPSSETQQAFARRLVSIVRTTNPWPRAGRERGRHRPSRPGLR